MNELLEALRERNKVLTEFNNLIRSSFCVQPSHPYDLASEEEN